MVKNIVVGVVIVLIVVIAVIAYVNLPAKNEEKEEKEEEPVFNVNGFSFHSMSENSLVSVTQETMSNKIITTQGNSISNIKGDVNRVKKDLKQLETDTNKQNDDIEGKIAGFVESDILNSKLKGMYSIFKSDMNELKKDTNNKIKEVTLKQSVNQLEQKINTDAQAKALKDEFKKYA